MLAYYCYIVKWFQVLLWAKKMSLGLFKAVINKTCLQIIFYEYKEDLAFK